MIDEVIENKTDNDLLSSRLGSQVSTTRPIYHLGWAPIYISPKILQDQGNSYDTKISTQNQMNLTPVPENSQHRILTDRKQSFHEKIPSAKMAPGPQKLIIFKKLNHIGLNAVDSLIFTAFLLGSFNIFQQFVYIDYAGNILCAVKLVLYHLLIFIHNSKVKFDEHQQKQTHQQKNFYINRLESYQLMQIWSIGCTICMLFAQNTPFIHHIISSMRLIRLFFIFFMHRKKQEKWRVQVFFHIIKITFIILVCTLLIAIALELLLYNIENYFCLSSTELAAINLGMFPSERASSCGLSKSCPVASDCKNIFSYTENQDQKTGIQLFLQNKSAPFSHNLLVSMLAVLSIGNSYHQYKHFVMQWLLLPLIAFIWLIFLTFTGIGIGESIRYESMQNWSRSLQMQRKMQQKLKKKGKNKNKIKRRISNITFNSNKLIQQQQNIVQTPEVIQFSQQINEISEQLTKRSIKQKIFTVLFNLASITQVCFLIVQNLNLSPWANTVSGVSLGVIFILWSFGLAFALYERISNPQQNKQNKYQVYILIYEILAYTLTISDYLMRIILKKYLFESSTEITPFSQAAISLRVVYVLFNNGFDAHISYFIQKMIQNLINNKVVIGFMIILGLSLGFVLNYNFEYFQKNFQIALVSTTISIAYGSNGGIPTQNLMLCSIGLLFATIGIIVNFYLAKHVNIGYDSILNIDFSQQTMQIPNKESEQKNISNDQSGCFIKTLKSVLQYHFYYKVKGLIVASYVILSLVFQQPTQSQSAQLIKFCIDVYLIIDIIAQLISYGLCKPNSYLWLDPIPKSLYIGTQIFLFIAYFVPNIQIAFVNSIRVSRGFILFGCIPELHEIYLLIKSVLFHPKIKIYKIVILSIPLMLVGMCLSSPYLDEPDHDNSSKFLNMMAFSTSFIYNLGWSFVGKRTPLTLSYLCLDLIFACLVLFLHVILTFMIVTYFVNRKVKVEGDNSQQILREYQTTDPQFYHCELANDRKIYAYLKMLKIIIICISTTLLGMLSGGWLEFSDKRTLVAVLNLFCCFVQIMIYIIENIFIKEGMQRWSIPQICLLGLSLPGSFFIAFPVIRFSHNTEVNLIVRIFLLFSMLRLLRIFNLFANRSIKIFSSVFLRRITKELYFQQTLGIFLFVVIAILPFSTFQANISRSECPQQFIKYLTGSIFPNEDIRVVQLIPKIICTWLILFPIRTMLLARVISSFLSNKPNELLFLRDKFANVISSSELILTLNQSLITKQTFFLPYNKIYSFSAQIDRIFRQFRFQKKLKCLSYDEIMSKINIMNIPLYKFINNDKKIYGVLLYDIIWNFYQDYKKNDGEKVEELNTLYGKAKHKKENIGRTHFGTHQLLAYLKIEKNIYRKIKQVRINMIKKCQE